jgi:adenine-specific DNA-methyltransferase
VAVSHSNRKPARSSSADVLNRVHLIDAREGLTWLEPDSVRLAHTSPPYNIGRPYAGYDDRREIDAYLDLIRSVVKELHRVLVPGGSLFWQSGYTQTDDGSILPIDHLTWPIFLECGFRLWDRVIWRYWGGMAFKRKWTNKHETILWLVKGGEEPYYDVFPVREASKSLDPRNNLFGRNPGNVWEVDRVAYGSRDQTSHIAVFPEEISDRLVLACSREGELCVDPFSGSGTLCSMARARGRRYFGTEITKEYYEDSLRRLGQHQQAQDDEILSALVRSVLAQNAGRARMDAVQTAVRDVLRSPIWQGLDDVDKPTRELLLKGDWGGTDGERLTKPRKRALWERLETYLGTPAGMGALQIADRAHRAAFRLARRFNTALRVHHAANWLTRLQKQAPKLPELLARVIESEPSTFTLKGSLLHAPEQAPPVAAVLSPTKNADPIGQATMFEA